MLGLDGYECQQLLFLICILELSHVSLPPAWIGSLSFGLVLFTGPLTTALCVRIGCRAVTVLGALMIGLGLFLSSYVTASYQLFFTYSVLFGVGSSCCYFTSVLILSEYFSKKLVFANGIALAGSGVGTLVLALFTNYLMETFQWRDTLRILSATAVVILLVGWIYRAVPAPFVPNESTEPQKMFNMALFKNQAYLIWIISLGLVQFGFYIPYVHLVSAEPFALFLWGRASRTGHITLRCPKHNRDTEGGRTFVVGTIGTANIRNYSTSTCIFKTNYTRYIKESHFTVGVDHFPRL